MTSARLPFEDDLAESRIDARDRAGRERAVDPRFNVALEASAGTGKTRVLVDRYVNLLRADVDPSNILAITFTRKAAAEMRDRIMTTLRAAAERGEVTPARWRELRDRTADITISTIDAFCLSLLREFPLEADVDPGFSIADDTDVPRLIDESLDRALRICRATAREDEHVALVFAQLGERRVRAGLAALLSRRIVAPRVLSRYLAKGPADLTVAAAVRQAATALMNVLDSMRGGFERFLGTGPLDPTFAVLAGQLRTLRAALEDGSPLDPAAVQATFSRVREHFLTQDGTPRTRSPYPKPAFASERDWQVHRDLAVGEAAAVQRMLTEYRRDLNVLVSRGIWRMYRIAESEYRRTLDARAVLDFSDLLLRALGLLRQMEEFAQSRYRLESRYHHVLVDEFQDTSRAQWELVSLLIQSWGAGAGLAHDGPLQPSVFIVGDRKQSIYGFRDADMSMLGEAARHLESLRPDRDVRRSISRSFRSVAGLLSFVNDVCHDVDKAGQRHDAFRYEEQDRFPLAGGTQVAARTEIAARTLGSAKAQAALGIFAADTPEACADIAASEIARLLADRVTIRDRQTGVPRPVRAGDMAILFRTRESHREFEGALAARGIRTYIYKGLGFFDADEIKDVLALLWYLADPLSNLRAAALLRARFFRYSDEELRRLAPRLAEAAAPLTARWRSLVDLMPPAELLDLILKESGYHVELRGTRFHQARENLKKMRGLLRRVQNRGYATMGRIAGHLDRLAVGDESNAVIDALDAVNLMTVHAAKGLEFPIVFLVNLARGTGNRRQPIRIASDPAGESVSVAVGDFQSDADEDERARDREETKRLLYVAMTRARDRLYLGSALKEGRMQPGRGSLAEVLPASLLDLFPVAAAGPGVVSWQASSGTAHTFVVPALDAARTLASASTARVEPPDVDVTPLADCGSRRHPGAASEPFSDAARVTGTLTHRLLHRHGFDGAHTVSREMVRGLLRPDEFAASDAVLDASLRAYRALGRRPDLQALYDAGDRLHEVPFTMFVDGSFVRGSIDCLVHTASDRFTVLEFKTGRARDEHRTQIELYRRAAEQLFPGCVIDARLVYLEEGPAEAAHAVRGVRLQPDSGMIES